MIPKRYEPSAGRLEWSNRPALRCGGHVAGYFDDKKRKYILQENGQRKEFPEQPSVIDRFKEGFESSSTKADLEALRKKRMSKSG